MDLSGVVLQTLIGLSVNAQTCQWAKTAGNNFNDEGNSVSTDVNGNVYVTVNQIPDSFPHYKLNT